MRICKTTNLTDPTQDWVAGGDINDANYGGETPFASMMSLDGSIAITFQKQIEIGYAGAEYFLGPNSSGSGGGGDPPTPLGIYGNYILSF